MPNSASITISPPGVPGVTAASGPYSGGKRHPTLAKEVDRGAGGSDAQRVDPLDLAGVRVVDQRLRLAPPREGVPHRASGGEHRASGIDRVPPCNEDPRPRRRRQRLARDRHPMRPMQHRLLRPLRLHRRRPDPQRHHENAPSKLGCHPTLLHTHPLGAAILRTKLRRASRPAHWSALFWISLRAVASGRRTPPSTTEGTPREGKGAGGQGSRAARSCEAASTARDTAERGPTPPAAPRRSAAAPPLCPPSAPSATHAPQPKGHPAQPPKPPPCHPRATIHPPRPRQPREDPRPRTRYPMTTFATLPAHDPPARPPPPPPAAAGRGRRRRRLHPRHRRRRPRRRQAQPRRHPLPPRAQRLPPHRPRQVDLPQLRDRPREPRRPLQPALRRHQPDHRRPRVRRGDPARRPLAGLRVGRPLLRLRLLRAVLRLGGGADRRRQGLRRQPLRGGDPRLPRHRHRAGPPQPLARPPGGGEPRPARPHAGRRVPRRRPRGARQDRHGVAEHEDARSAPLPHPPRPPLPARRRLVPLPDVRLGPPALRRHRGDHPLALHPGVREQPRAVRLGDRQHLGAVAAAADRVRPPQPDLHGDEQAQAAPARRAGAGGRLGRPADADPVGAAPARLHPGGDPRLLRPGGGGQGQQHHRRRPARARHPRRPQHPGAAGDGRAAPAQGGDRELPGGPERGAGGPLLAARRAPRGLAAAPLLAASCTSSATTSPRRRRGGSSGWRPAARCASATPTSCAASGWSRTRRAARWWSCAAATTRPAAAAPPPTAARSRGRSSGCRRRTPRRWRCGSTIGSTRPSGPSRRRPTRSSTATSRRRPIRWR